MRIPSALATLLLAAACGGDAAPPPPPATTTTTAPARAGLPADLLALESAPASTPPLAQTVALAPAPVAGLSGVPGTSPAAGPADALVHVVLFTDFQCPVCRRAAEPVKLLARRFPDDVRVVVKHAASPLHPRAPDAAAASLAAFRQGAFWAFYDQTFVDPRRLENADLLATAERLGLDLGRFRADMASEAVREQVRYETALASRLDAAGTPSFVVNGVVQRGWGSYLGLERLVERELGRARALLAEGLPRTRVALEATRVGDPDRGPLIATALFGGEG